MVRVLYIGTLMRSVLSLHDLIRNKHEYRKSEIEKSDKDGKDGKNVKEDKTKRATSEKKE